MIKFTNDKKIIDIFTQYYFTKNKYLLFFKERDLEIDLLNSQKAIESSHRFELEQFYQDGITSLQDWMKENHCEFPILDNELREDKGISLNVKKIFWIIDHIIKHDKNNFELNKNDEKQVIDFKNSINKIILKNYFVHPYSKQIISNVITEYISHTYFTGMNDFYEKIIKSQSSEKLKKVIFKIEKHIEDTKKVILIEKVLRELHLLDQILHSYGDPFRRLEPDSPTHSTIQNQNDMALSDFISFQFFTSLYLRGENISEEVMKNNSLREGYLQKLEEMTKIDELRLNRTKIHRNQIIEKLSSS